MDKPVAVMWTLWMIMLIFGIVTVLWGIPILGIGMLLWAAWLGGRIYEQNR